MIKADIALWYWMPRSADSPGYPYSGICITGSQGIIVLVNKWDLVVEKNKTFILNTFKAIKIYSLCTYIIHFCQIRAGSS
jgi:hypothetical protein